jgi:hypothetical protein
MDKITQGFFKANSRRTIKVLLSLFAMFSMGGNMVRAQVTLPHYDGINYTAGESLAAQTAGGWILNQNATSDLQITAGSLNYTGLATSTGNKVAFSSGGEDAIKTFTQTTSGTIYYSYLLNLTDIAALTSGYVAGIIPNSAASAGAATAPGSGAIASTVWVKPSATPGFYNIGFTGRANQTTTGTGATNLQYSAVDYPVNTPVFIVVSYQIVSGNSNDITTLWVNPVPGAAQPAATLTASLGTDIADVTAFFIKQNGSSSTPATELDEIRIGLTWASVTPGAPVALVTPTLTADVTGNTVDNTIDITFTDNAAWRAAVTQVKVGTVALTEGTDYELTAGNLKLKPAGLNALLTVSGSKAVSVVATGYTDALVTQEINAGVATGNSTATINTSLAPNTTSTITCTAKDQYNNLVPGYVFKYDIIVANTNATITESYLIDGTARTATIDDLAVSAATNAAGIAEFTVTLPALIDSNDGIIIPVQLNNGTTGIAAAFMYIQLPTSQSITFGALNAVVYGSPDFTLTATASSSLAVTYASSNPLVATVSNNGLVTITGVGTTTITASQAGNNIYSPADSLTQNLIVTCAPSTATINGAITICTGEGANLQVAIAELEVQQYTVVYSDGTVNYTVTNYTNGAFIPVTPTATTTYTLVSVTGTNANLCTSANSDPVTISVTTTPPPSGDNTQVFTTDDPVLISNLIVNGTNVVWYASQENAVAGTSPLASNFVLTTGTTYYAMQTVNGCRSQQPLAVTVTVILGSESFTLAGLKYYPNPATNVLNIMYTEVITKVKVYNSLGQVVLSVQPNSVNPSVNLDQLPASNYFVEIQSNRNKKVVQLLKR